MKAKSIPTWKWGHLNVSWDHREPGLTSTSHTAYGHCREHKSLTSATPLAKVLILYRELRLGYNTQNLFLSFPFNKIEILMQAVETFLFIIVCLGVGVLVFCLLFFLLCFMSVCFVLCLFWFALPFFFFAFCFFLMLKNEFHGKNKESKK